MNNKYKKCVWCNEDREKIKEIKVGAKMCIFCKEKLSKEYNETNKQYCKKCAKKLIYQFTDFNVVINCSRCSFRKNKFL